ncbi:hypothetical protein SAMN04488072_103216 [Lentibacillus halodurans]|uniref:Uncharacterized protein n=1 Tax=Lentibacillus halodurans TaxID=237679 RepID=A0A1I0WQR7_9BACI|nr:hypothetical protein [Lentibacillus halodurans]SFA91099.1 hypothetical protein SAMN04488072_103216 [Lentibacillus halodurans]
MKAIEETLQNRAKKHKKLFEKYWIEPNHLYFKGSHFYLSFYERFQKTEIGILSTQSEVSNADYKEAFEWLVILMNRMAAIQEVGMERKNINMKGFYKTRAYLEKTLEYATLSSNEKNIIDQCLHSMNDAISLQNRMVALMDEFEQFREKKETEGNEFSVPEVEEVHDFHAEMDYIQFTQGQISYKSVDFFASLNQIINQNETIKSIVNFEEVKQYIEEFSRGKDMLKSSLDEATYVDNLDQLSKEQFMKTVQEDYIKRQKESNKSLIKNLRYPTLG